MTRDKRLMRKSEEMRSTSGAVDCDDPLVLFLYLLARNELAIGIIENLMGQVYLCKNETTTQYTNGWLAQWAMDCAGRLRREES